ncbi:hypothetical protein [Nonomuraea sp. NPDC049646]|uniref:hypothetical protein n=1 Tax=Nonomuraea sp. NPDC049646 TaxID=3364354 RepID=UPI0037A4FDAA
MGPRPENDASWNRHPHNDAPQGPQPEGGAPWSRHPQNDASRGPQSGENPTRGAQPEDDASWTPAPGQWAAVPEEDPPAWPGQSAVPGTPPWEQPGPVVPGAPPWEPPPAFTAAAAGLQVWPAPVADPHAMPPWPAATGELVAEPDTDDPALGDRASGDRALGDRAFGDRALGDPTARFPTTQAGHPAPPAAADRRPTPFPTQPTDAPIGRSTTPTGAPATHPTAPPGTPTGHPAEPPPGTPTGHSANPPTSPKAGRPAEPPTGPSTGRPTEPPTGPTTGRPTASPGTPSTAAAGTASAGTAATGVPADPNATAPAFPHDPAAPYNPAAPYDQDAPYDQNAPYDQEAPYDPGHPPYPGDALDTPDAAPHDAPAPVRFGSEPGRFSPEAASFTPEAVSYDPDATRPGGIPKAAHYFDPEAAKRDAAATVQQHATPAPPRDEHEEHEEHDPAALDTPPQGMRASDPREEPTGPMRTAHHVEPHPTNPTGRPPEPGDVPVWPPMPPAEDKRPEEKRPEDRHPDARPDEATQRATGHSPDAPAQNARPTERDPDDKQAEPRPSPEPHQDPSPTQEKLPDLPFNQDLWTKRPGTALDLPTPPHGTPTFPPGAFRQPPFQIPPPPPPARGKSKRALLVTLGALALAGVATGGFFAYRALSTAPPAATTAGATPAPSTLLPTSELTTSPSADVPGASMLNSEETDPKKMSLTEAFPKKKVSAAGTTFTRVKTDTETSCDKAATGAFADALRERKCSRIIRATFVDSKRRYAVTTGIAVLPTKEDAVQTDQAKNLPRNVWFRALPGAKGSGGERVSIAGGYAAGLVWGRYIVFSYATHADGHTPDAGDKTLAKVSGAFRDQTSLVLERRVTKG